MKNIINLFITVALFACSSTKKDKNNQNSESYGLNSKVAKSGDANSLSKDKFVADRVFFDFDSFAITKESKDTAKSQADFLKNAKINNITIAGHTDERGTEQYNLILGKKRAEAVKKALIQEGLSKSVKVKILTYGKQKPEVFGNTEDTHAKNRRAVLTIN